MSKTYAFLRQQPPAFYRDPENLRTSYPLDRDPARCEEHYQRGLKVSREWPEVYVSANGVWGASAPCRSLSSYEGLGYHAGTADFWRGVLAGPALVRVYRDGWTVIKEAGVPAS